MTLSCSGYAVKTVKHGITKSVLGSVTQKSLMMSISALITERVTMCLSMWRKVDLTVVRYSIPIPEIMLVLALHAYDKPHLHVGLNSGQDLR